MEYIEVTGKSVDEAITNACLKLETSSDKIEYEVIDKGSNGLFGIFNSKPAKIKARVKSGVDSVDEEFKEFEKNEKKAFSKLTSYFQKLGFEKIKGMNDLLFYCPFFVNKKLDEIDLNELTVIPG